MAISNLLSNQNHSVHLYHYNPDFIDTIIKGKRHPNLPNLEINSKINFTSEKNDILNSDYVFIAVPTTSLRSVLGSIKFSDTSYIISLSKGIENKSHLFPSQIINECTRKSNDSICVLSGPSHAEEVSIGIPTAVVIAGANITLNQKVQKIISSPTLRAYSNSDVLGVEIAGAVKNVISIASGICCGLGFGDNTIATVITRGLNEIVRFAKTLGADQSTFYGLAGVGDLCVTSFSKHSRNKQFGILIGKNTSPIEALDKMNMTVEGYYTSKSLYDLMISNNIDMPISKAVYSILYENLSPKQAIMDLMSRDLTYESN